MGRGRLRVESLKQSLNPQPLAERSSQTAQRAALFFGDGVEPLEFGFTEKALAFGKNSPTS